jgi:hypothetical protein
MFTVWSLIVLLGVLAGVFFTHLPQAPIVVKCGPNDTDAPAAADTLLDEWKAGYSGADMWVGGIQKKKLFNVTDFDRLAQKYSVEGTPHASVYSFRVKSSTKGGFPVTQTWEIYVEQQGDACKVYDVEQAE